MLKKIVTVLLGLGLTTSAFAGNAPCVNDLNAYIRDNSLDIRVCNMKAEDVPAVADFMRAHPTLTELDLGDDSILSIDNVKLLLDVPTLLSLDLSWDSISLSSQVVAQIAKSQTLKSLNISFSDVDADEMNALSKNISIEDLDISNVSADNLDDIALLGKSVTLKRLTMFSRSMNDKILQSIANIPSLEELYVGDQYLNTKFTESTLLKVAANRHLKVLAIVYQNITLPVMQAFALNPNLDYLILVGDHINNDGAAYFKNMPKLTRLVVDENKIGDAGLVSISQNAGLKVLSAESNQFSDVGFIDFAKNSQVSQVNFSRNQGLTYQSLQALLSMPQLKTIDLVATGLTDDASILIAHQRNLVCINLNYNHIGHNGASAFALYGKTDVLSMLGNEFSLADSKAIQQNPAIKHLWTDWLSNAFDFRSCVYYAR